MSLIRPPALATSTVLNRAAFAATFHIAAASVRNPKHISRIRQALSKSSDLFSIERHPSVVPDPDAARAARGRKCLLLAPAIEAARPDTWGPVLAELVRKEDVGVFPYALRLGYDYWTYRDVLTALLPRALHADIPAGFNTAGHVAHLNLREQHLPYKALIAEVLIDKNSHIRTVINKTDDVGAVNEFRTFPYEVLAGEDDLDVEVRENNCVFSFDYGKVYWNSKLEHEHTRLIALFKPGEVVCDVMAGIGPFAVPAGKKGVFVWANDYNPESYRYLQGAITKNKVEQFVKPFNLDGRVFIHQAADAVLAASQAGDAAVVPGKKPVRNAPEGAQAQPTRVPVPPTIAHFVMNLPASATEFLRHFRGVYEGRAALFAPRAAGGAPLPVVHCHCFAPRSDAAAPRRAVAARVAAELGAALAWDGVMDAPGGPASRPSAQRPGAAGAIADGTVAVHAVRDVSPHKSMYCASFRLPAEVAFAPRD